MCVDEDDVVGGMRGSCLTYTVAATGVQDSLRSLFGIFWKLVVFQELRVSAKSQDLREEDKKCTQPYRDSGVI